MRTIISHVPMSPVNGSLVHGRTTSRHSARGILKRVCKACDRCRLKKGKCDGSSPCSRCKANNAICVFGERRRVRDRTCPKGYVELLEQQQSLMVRGLKEMYHRLQQASAWDGLRLNEADGHPLTHDILAVLGVSGPESDDSHEVKTLKGSPEELKSRMAFKAFDLAQSRGPVSLNFDHSYREQSQSTAPVQPAELLYDDKFSLRSASSSSLTQIASPRPKPSSRRPRQHGVEQPSHSSPFQVPIFGDDRPLYAPLWSQALADIGQPDEIYACTEFGTQTGCFKNFGSCGPAQAPMTSISSWPSYQNQTCDGSNILGSDIFASLPAMMDMIRPDDTIMTTTKTSSGGGHETND